MITEMSVSRFLIAKSFRSLFFLSDVHRLRIFVEEMEKLLSVFLWSVFIALIAYLVSAAEILKHSGTALKEETGDREGIWQHVGLSPQSQIPVCFALWEAFNPTLQKETLWIVWVPELTLQGWDLGLLLSQL